MNTTIGMLALLFGAFTLGGYVLKAFGRGPDLLFRKLGPMQQRFGKRLGAAIHFTAYVAIPLTAGVVFLLSTP